jgi:predicted molibdopterin-dependent oxidoreductase YjgC
LRVNELTGDARHRDVDTPEYKVVAVNVEPER